MRRRGASCWRNRSGAKCAGFREKLGITISELAKAADMSAGMLSKIENGATSPSLGSLQALGRPCMCRSRRCSAALRKSAMRLS